MSEAEVLEREDPHLDAVRRDREVDTGESMRLAMERSGVSFAQQSKDLLRLRRGPGGIEPNEYYYLGLYDRSLFDDAAREAFVGRWRAQRLTSALVEEVFGKTINKFETQAMLAAAGVPVPRTLAAYGGGELAIGEVERIRSLDDLRSTLSSAPAGGLFGKPVQSVCSLGVLSIDRYQPESDGVCAADGRIVPLQELMVELRRYEEHGYQLQERLRPHPEIEAILGNRIGTLRVLVVNGDPPVIARVSWKIPGGTNMADNFWRRGNMLGAVDPETGEIERVVDDVYPRLQEVSHHPRHRSCACGCHAAGLVRHARDRHRRLAGSAAASAPRLGHGAHRPRADRRRGRGQWRPSDDDPACSRTGAAGGALLSRHAREGAKGAAEHGRTLVAIAQTKAASRRLSMLALLQM